MRGVSVITFGELSGSANRFRATYVMLGGFVLFCERRRFAVIVACSFYFEITKKMTP